MFRLVIVASLLVGCRISLEDNSTGDSGTGGRQCTVNMTSQPCLDAVGHSDLAWIESKIFTASCNFSGCHNGADTPQGKVDLRPGMSRAHLVGFASLIPGQGSRQLVVPNNVAASYLMLMLGDVPPAMASPPGDPPSLGIGFMPQGAPILCCQKLDALEAWINAGAPSL
jgi:hypothetical protein